MSERYSTTDVPVAGGTLRVGIWDGPAPDTPTALLVHGVTASHRSWPVVADQLSDLRLIAPDLRGRGRSHPEGEAGMAAHADDLAAVLDHLGIERTVVVGHSMGAFASLVLADRHPDRVSRLVLVDGGLPLEVPDGLSADEVISYILGPAAERLAMRFASTADYLDFWRPHPAFAGDWSAALEDYLAYDLVGEAPELRPATSYEVVARDTVDLITGTALVEALGRLRHPALLLTAPRGLLDETPGLYEPTRLAGLVAQQPTLRAREVDDVNHYTITMAETGAKAVAEAVRGEVASA
ncbi:alpha/beta hydrolase [Nocardioides sp. YIM 152588]|uniref:alpha/beta hydrolase n=1 Tax=Nocardioides sp. YIM 152588 TaxID=3158259 RepID=UPI0032E529C5